MQNDGVSADADHVEKTTCVIVGGGPAGIMLGLAEDFARFPHRNIDTVNMNIQGTELGFDLRRIPSPHKLIALGAAAEFPRVVGGRRRIGADVSAAAQL